MNEFDLLQNKLSDEVRENIGLAQFTTFKIGGPAKYFYEADNPRKFVLAYDTAVTNRIKHFILGGGSNILFADEGFDGLVVRDGCREYSVDGDSISAQSGVWLNDLIDIATEHSLTGLEFAAGIPGNVGGAVYGNAGAFGGCIADVLESAVVYNPYGGTKIVDRNYFAFAYRHSKLKEENELILSARFKLKSGDKSRIADKANDHRRLRRVKHPVTEGCAGSVFKNIKQPELLPAGKLLEDAGVRGMTVGGAEIYKKHCNIIVNKGKATASDVRQLASMMRQKVFNKFNIKLEYEMLILHP